MKVPPLVGAEDHFGPRAGVGTGPYRAFVYRGVFYVETRLQRNKLSSRA